MVNTVQLPGTIDAPYYLDITDKDEILTDIPDPEDNDTATTPDSPVAAKTRIKGVSWELSHLVTSYNPNPVIHSQQEIEESVSEETVLTMIPDMNIYPSSYKNAMTLKDKNLWWPAMVTEFDHSESKNVWKIVKKSDLPKGRKLKRNR
jgi:hypothetical protein